MATSTESEVITPEMAAANRSGLRWLGVGVAVLFAAMFLAYFFAFRAVREAHIQEVPVVTRGSK